MSWCETPLSDMEPTPLTFRAALRRPASGWITAASGLLAALTGLTVLLLSIESRSGAFDRAQQTAGTLAAVLAEHADRLIESTDLVRAQVDDMVRAGGKLPADEESYRRLARLAERMPHVAAIWVGDAQGNAVLTSRRFPTPRLSAADRDYFKVIRDEPDRLFIGLLPDNRFTNEIVINTSRRIASPNGEFIGFTQVAVSPEYLRALLRRVAVGYDIVLLVLDPSGRPILREPPVPLPTLNSAPTYSGLPIPAGASQGRLRATSPFDGVERIYAYERSPAYGLTLVAGISTSDIQRQWQQAAWTYGLAGGALVMGLLVFGAILAQRIRKQENFARLLSDHVAARTRALTDALDEQQALLAEMNHRVKNAFATVQAITRQTVRSAPDLKSFEAVFVPRLTALAKAHALSTKAENETGADLHALVDVELAPYQSSDGQRIRISGVQIALDGGRALSLTLVIHELATNAAKYGALSVPGGSLTVDWVVQGSVLRLTWTERGGPEVQQPDRRGFGSRLIDRSLQSHNGHAIFTFRPSGVEAELTLPLQERRSTSHSPPGS